MNTKTPTSSEGLGTLSEEIAKSKNTDWLHEGGLAVSRFIEDNAKSILGVVAAVLIGWSGYLVWNHLQVRGEKAAFEAFFPIEKSLNDYKEKVAKAEAAQAELDAAAKAKPAKKPTTTAADAKGPSREEALALADRAAEFAKQHAKQVAGAMAALEASSLYSQNAEAQKSVDVLKQTLAGQGSQASLWSGLVRVSLATQLVNLAAKENAASCDEAQSVLDPLLKEKTLSFLWSEAHLRLGFCHQLNGRTDQAKAAFGLAQKPAPDTEKKDSSSNGNEMMANPSLGAQPGSAAEAATSISRALDAGIELVNAPKK